MRRIREELDHLQESLSAKDVRLDEREEQLNALAARLDAKGRELATLNDLINQERQKLQAKDAELRKQEGFVSRARDLEEALRNREASLTLRERAMRRTLEALKRQARELEQQQRELRRSALRNHPAIAMRALTTPATWRIPLVVAVAVLAAAGVYSAIPASYRVHATWARTDGGPLPVDAVRKVFTNAVTAVKPPPAPRAAIPTNAPAASWTADKATQGVSLEFAARDPVAAGRTVNTCGQASLAVLERSDAADAPTADDVERLRQQREQLRQALGRTQVPVEPANTTTTPSAGSVEAMITRVDELAASRQTIRTQLAATRAKLATIATRPADADIEIAPAVRSEAHAADAELTQARRRLKDQQETVRALLASAFAAAEPSIGEARRAIDELLTNTNTYRQNPPDAEAGGELDALHDEAAKAKDRLDAFANNWSAARAALKQAPDPVAAQRTIETTVKEYVAASAAETASLERRIQAIGETGSQITKRLVVRAGLTKSLRRLTEAHRDLVDRIDNVTAAANFRLEAAIQTATGAGETISARVGVIDADLRERFGSRAKQDRERQVAELHQEEQTLTAKAADLTDSLVPAQQALQELTRRWLVSLARTGQRQAAERERNRLRDELAQVDERLEAIRVAAAAKVIPVRFIPASYSPQPINRGTRLGWSVLAALIASGLGLLLADPGLRASVRDGTTRAFGILTHRKSRSNGTIEVPEANGRNPQPPVSASTPNGEPK